MSRISSPTALALIVGLLMIPGALYALSSPNTYAPRVRAQTATSLSIEECTEVSEGETFSVTIRISSVSALFAWELYFAYDRDLLEVVGRDVRLFLAEGGNSNVFDVSDPIPNSTGLYRLAAADVALGATAESGSGALADVMLRAKGTGVSPAAIYRPDAYPLGPSLTTLGGDKIGDVDGDDIFDGDVTSGQIAIGVPCAPVAPTPAPDLGEGVIPVSTPPISVTSSPVSPGPTDTDGPGPSPSPSSSSEPSTSSPGPDDGSVTAGPAPVSGNGGFGSGSDNTMWAVFLIGGGVALGLVVTYIVAITTRRPA